MLFSYNWLKDYIKGELPKPEKLAELLAMHSFEVGGVKKTGKDRVLDIDVLPNRGPDCFSHIGIAREIGAITKSRIKNQESRIKEDKNLRTKDFIAVEVKGKDDCSRYTARIVADVKVGASPKWIQERLKVCGLKPINNIVDIANYVMLETGQPLHVFDFNKIENMQIRNPLDAKRTPRRVASEIRNKFKTQNSKLKTIIVRRAKKGEKIVTLDNEKYNLDKDILIIADEKEPLAVAGIKGGKKAEIDKKTKTVVLESANFNSRVVRRGSQELELKTDASWRFEHQIDPNLTETAINRAAGLIQEIAGGAIAQGLVDFYPRKVLPKKIKLNIDYTEKLLGIKIPVKEIKNILTKLEFKFAKTRSPQIGQPQIMVEAPTFRLDISLQEDLIEEIGRIYGYQKIPAVFPLVSLIPPKKNFQIFWENIVKNILKEMGFTEVYNYSFISESDRKIFGDKNLIEIENPISIEQKYLRASLIPNLLKNIQKNQKYFDEIKIFELGKIFTETFLKKSAPAKTIEKKMLTGVITGDAFYQVKGVIDLLLIKLGISNIWYDSYQPTPEESKLSIWHPKKRAEIKVDHQEIGFLGEIRPGLLETLKIEGKLVIFDIDFGKLQKLCSEEHEYQPISQYPEAVRDLAVLTPRDVKVVDVLNKIEAVSGPLVRDVNLFDIYEGEELAQGKKNLAFHIIYQAENRTLTAKEIDEIQNKIIKTLESEPDWQVRQ